MAKMKENAFIDKEINVMHKEWDQVSCLICMDHPHNAVLLICSSYEKGCRPYICDTSYRHSNCLDRFKKMKEDWSDDFVQPSSSFPENSISRRAGQEVLYNQNSESSVWSSDNVQPYGVLVGQVHGRVGVEMSWEGKTSELNDVKCPLCRGAVYGWKIPKEAREYLDLKQRSCSRESCSFIGNYKELRRHARRVHPTIRPADIDPSRQNAWTRLEHQQAHSDILSAFRTAMPGAVVVGDYIIDAGDELSQDWDMNFNDGSWTTLFLLDMIETSNWFHDEPRDASRSSRQRHSPIAHQNILGEGRRHSPIGHRTVLGERRRHLAVGRQNILGVRWWDSPIGRHHLLNQRQRHSPLGHHDELGRRRHSQVRRRNLLHENMSNMEDNDYGAWVPDRDDNRRTRNLFRERRQRRRNLLQQNLFSLQDDADPWETDDDYIPRPRNLVGERRQHLPIRSRNSLRENLLNLQDNEVDAWQTDSGDISRPRRRQRFTRSIADDEQF